MQIALPHVVVSLSEHQLDDAVITLGLTARRGSIVCGAIHCLG